jgi:hypothetical protein
MESKPSTISTSLIPLTLTTETNLFQSNQVTSTTSSKAHSSGKYLFKHWFYKNMLFSQKESPNIFFMFYENFWLLQILWLLKQFKDQNKCCTNCIIALTYIMLLEM